MSNNTSLPEISTDALSDALWKGDAEVVKCLARAAAALHAAAEAATETAVQSAVSAVQAGLRARAGHRPKVRRVP